MKKRLIFLALLMTILISTAIVGSFLGALLFFILKYIFRIEGVEGYVGGIQLYLWGALFGYRLKVLIENYSRVRSVPLSDFLVNGHKATS